MSYDSKPYTITFGPGEDFLADMGAHGINMLGKSAQDPTSSVRLKRDWKIVAAWLGSAEHPISLASNEKVRRAWRAYIAAGIAPSLALQPTFDNFNKDYRSAHQSYLSDKPPKDLTGVFDRLLASDNEIKEKNIYDRVLAYDSINTQETENQLAETIGLLRSFSIRFENSWWRLRSRAFFGWDFVSLVLAAASFFCVVVFVIFAWWFFDRYP